VALSYDFSSEAQIEDFRAWSGSTRREKNHLVLSGECRLLGGEPFVNRLSVRLKVPANGYVPAAPNIGVALFTRADDRLTSPLGDVTSLLAVPGSGLGSMDFPVFGLGYRTVTAEYGGQEFEDLTIPGQVEPVKLPANAVLAGRRGRLLHAGSREALWAKPLGAPLRGALILEVAVGGGETVWKLNGKGLVDGREGGLDRLRVERPWRGSVTLFTHGSTVRLASIDVEGEVSRDWLRAGIHDEAVKAFRDLEAGGK